VTSFVELRRRAQSGRAGANDCYFLARTLLRWIRPDVAQFKSLLGNGFLNMLNGYRGLIDA